MKLNVCLNDYYAGGTQGGMRRSGWNYATCPSCGKRVQITLSGRLRVHGTRKEA